MKILIVEDSIPNAVTAMQFFEAEGVGIEIAETLEEDFLGAIIDVEIPQRSGQKPARLGPKVGELAKKRGVPYVYLTGGYFHHGPEARIFLDELCLEKNEGETAPDKTNLQSWAKAWETLQSMGNLQEIYNARVRYKKYTGKNYERR